MNIFVEDCESHEKALEVLSECMTSYSIDNCNINNLMNDLYLRLTVLTSIRKLSGNVKTIAQAILTRSFLDVEKFVPRTKKPDQFVQTGLI